MPSPFSAALSADGRGWSPKEGMGLQHEWFVEVAVLFPVQPLTYQGKESQEWPSAQTELMARGRVGGSEFRCS